jgi:hypothetical protein
LPRTSRWSRQTGPFFCMRRTGSGSCYEAATSLLSVRRCPRNRRAVPLLLRCRCSFAPALRRPAGSCSSPRPGPLRCLRQRASASACPRPVCRMQPQTTADHALCFLPCPFASVRHGTRGSVACCVCGTLGRAAPRHSRPDGL